MAEQPNTRMMQTVLGSLAASEAGITMPHEHVFLDLTIAGIFDPPREASEITRAYAPITLETIGWIRYNYFKHFENCRLIDEDEAVSELQLYWRFGGETIVDVTPIGIGRDPLALARVSRATGVNIVMSTGYYVGPTHPAYVEVSDEDELAERMAGEITDGAVLPRPVGEGHDFTREDTRTDVRAGAIKVGCSYPLLPAETKVLRAAAKAQQATGAPITIHVGRHDLSALEIAETLAVAGADISRVVLGHLDVRVERLETLDAVAATGCFLEFDLFGNESSYYPTTGVGNRDMPSDGQRLDLVEHVVERGYLERVLISQDVGTKHRLIRYGGHGYGYIAERVAPRMRERGFTPTDIRTILVDNPANAIAFAGSLPA
jgi:phosphotriesterase-related protein